MGKHTVVIEFNGDEPAYGANMELLGGRVVAVAFADELERSERIELQRDDLLEALENLHKEVLGRTGIYGDYYLSPTYNYALSAIAKARGEA